MRTESSYRATAVLVATSIALLSASASAGTSRGSGGAVGVTRTDWPCAGCQVEVPAGLDQTSGVKLLVLLHGDEGNAGPIFSAFAPELAKTTDFILFAPQCPLADHCTDGAWWHTGPPTHDWINQQVAAIESAYDIDYDHEHLGGVSGGAIYISAILGYLYPDRYASANLISGGIRPSVATCPSPVMPLFFVEGDADFEYTTGQTPATRDYYLACGGEVKFELVPGLDHQAAANHAIAEIPTILDWFRMHPNTSPGRRGIDAEQDGGAQADGGMRSDGSGTGSTGSGLGAPPAGGDHSPSGAAANGSAPSAANEEGAAADESGCACRATAPAHGTDWSWVTTIVVAMAIRRRRGAQR